MGEKGWWKMEGAGTNRTRHGTPVDPAAAVTVTAAVLVGGEGGRTSPVGG